MRAKWGWRVLFPPWSNGSGARVVLCGEPSVRAGLSATLWNQPVPRGLSLPARMQTRAACTLRTHCQLWARSGQEWERFRKRSEEHTSELQSRGHLVCRLLLEKKKHKGADLRPNS